MSRRALVATSLLALLLTGKPALATGPDPTLATVLSVASTLTPMAVTAGLWATGRGPEEGVRFDVGMGALAVGTIVGPSIGQFYAEAGTNAWVSLLLRSVTGSIMLTGVGFWARGAEEDAGLGQALTVVGGVPHHPAGAVRRDRCVVERGRGPPQPRHRRSPAARARHRRLLAVQRGGRRLS